MHYHYNDSVNKFNNDVIEELIDKLSPSSVMGDFNSNPVFNGYYDVLKGFKTFPTHINATDLLDHIFVKDNLNCVGNLILKKLLVMNWRKLIRH